jgi:outer membrane protein OmpA-like peptidoglycan-associated protein
MKAIALQDDGVIYQQRLKPIDPSAKQGEEMNRIRSFPNATTLLMVALLVTGCATNQTVRKEIAASEQKQSQAIDGLRQQMGAEHAQLQNVAAQATSAEKNSGLALLLAQDASRDITDLKSAFAARNDLLEKKQEVVYFGFDRDDLDDTARTVLDSVAALAGTDKNYIMVLEGHTDRVGTNSYNYALSDRRAASVIRYLVGEKGSDRNRIYLLGLGESYPVADNDSQEGRLHNRRVIIRIMAPR